MVYSALIIPAKRRKSNVSRKTKRRSARRTVRQSKRGAHAGEAAASKHMRICAFVFFSTDSVFSDLPEVRLNAEGDIRAGHGSFFAEKHLQAGAVPPRGELCRVYDSGGAFCQIGQARELDRGGTAIFCKINFGSKE